MATLEALTFDNHFTRSLPADPEAGSRRRQVQGAIFSRVLPTAVREPALLAAAEGVAELIGLDPDQIWRPEFAAVFTGNTVLPGMDPHATCYGGHQFGNWAYQLGDGRAINLGEVVSPAAGRFMLQLKGAGPTPYSRTADGLAVLRSSVREFLCSEAMHHLGVPTTRALSLTTTGESVMRDMLYDGHPALEPGAVVCRVAPSFLRFGHFELLAARREVALLEQLVRYLLETQYPELHARYPNGGADACIALFAEVTERTAFLMAEWMRVGFVHGVMNTDNMSMLGLTIDYGPYGWLENVDPDWTPNTTDGEGRRYRFGNQPGIAHWNLLQLANALYPLVEEAAPLEAVLNAYPAQFQAFRERAVAAKLGLSAWTRDDDALVTTLERLLAAAETDMTIWYRSLADVQGADTAAAAFARLKPAFYQPDALTPPLMSEWHAWFEAYLARVRQDGRPDGVRRADMHAVNPRYVLRNYLAQLAIDGVEAGDRALLDRLQQVLARPYDEQPEHTDLAALRPDWARTRVGCSMLSCSS